MFLSLLQWVSVAWMASEVALALLRRSGANARRQDAGSLRLLNAVIYSAVAVGVTLALQGRGVIALPAAVRWAGLAVIVVGLAVRWWAILTLRRFFTVDVAIHADHALVDRGPYRLVRHPAYSGALLSFVGLAVSLASWVALLVILVPIVAAFARRISIEEQALRDAFPKAYEDYARRTKRLVPGVY